MGLLHPRIILPERSRDWPQAQLDAVLAHEGEHVRRRDPLFQWLALLNRALFWFHPLAWWLERKLSGLAEEACDAAVIARGHDPREYSEYLLDLARSVERAGTRIEAVGMAMPGIGLKHRIRQMLGGVAVPRISRLRMVCTVAVCAAAAAILAAGTLVRAQPPQLAFEVASIKPMAESSAFLAGISISGNRVTVSGPLRHMMTSAYGVPDYQISGGPSWVDRDLFEIRAKAESPGTLSADQARQMLQTLLADRFRLKLHREKRELPVYALVVDRNGTKLKKSADDTKFDLAFTMGPPSRIVATMPMTSFVYQLSHLAVRERPVVDQTGLSGRYDFTLEWTPAGAAADVANGPSIFTAVQEQLGLRLEPQRAPVEVLVIDHVEKPSAN